MADKDFALFLKERKPKGLSELSKIADQYMEAHTWNQRKSDTVRPRSSNPSTQKPNLLKVREHVSI